MKNDIDIGSMGDHFFVGLQPATQLTTHDRSLLGDLRPAGVILFKSNFVHGVPYDEWLASHSRLIAQVREAVRRERMIIAIDHEGGRVCRTPAPMTRFAYASQWADQAASVGAAMGRELASLGVNLSFAPVLDINSNPANPVIGPRSFGQQSDRVTSAALAFMSALQNQAVLACGKHFPGHGDADADSHYALPVLRQSLDALRARELQPFVAAIQANIPMLMTGHMFLPAVDGVEPVTLSKRFTHDLLRRELGFTGVVTTDDLGMKAVSGIFDDPTAAARVIASGTDLLMVCPHWTNTDRCRGFAAAILDAARTGTLSERVLEQSKERIHALLSRSKTHDVTRLPDEVFKQNQTSGELFVEETVEIT